MWHGPGWTSTIATSAASAPVLVVITDAYLRVLVGSLVAQMDLAAILKPTWIEAVMTTTGLLSCMVADLDDVGDKTADVAVLRKS